MYQYLRLAQDENIQKRGIVSIIYMVDQPDSIMSDRYELWTMARIRQAAPVRTCCQHLCYNNPTLKRVMNFVLPVLNPAARSRLAAHYGMCLILSVFDSFVSCCYESVLWSRGKAAR